MYAESHFCSLHASARISYAERYVANNPIPVRQLYMYHLLRSSCWHSVT